VDFTTTGLLMSVMIFVIVFSTIALLSSIFIQLVEMTIYSSKLEDMIIQSTTVLQTLFKNANLSLGTTVTSNTLTFNVVGIDNNPKQYTIRFDDSQPDENSLLFTNGTVTTKLVSFPKKISVRFFMNDSFPMVEYIISDFPKPNDVKRKVVVLTSGLVF